MKRVFILGLGTGRCGTVSLATLLSKQQKTDISHELKPNLSWTFNEDQISKRFNAIVTRKKNYIGDISSYNLNYVEYVSIKCNERGISLKILHIYREKDKVVNSFMKKTIGRNHWSRHDNTTWRRDHIWDPCFPKYNIPSKKEAIYKYYEEYINKCNSYKEKYDVYSFEIEDLNSKFGVKKILDFCGYKNQQIITKIKKNATV